MKVAVIGGGNIGTLMACDIAKSGHEVKILSSKPSCWNPTIEVWNVKEELLYTIRIKGVTDSLQELILWAEFIWITYPAQMFEQIAKEMEPFVREGQIVGVVPGSGGAEFAFRQLVKKGIILCGLQRVHSIARLKEYGKGVYELGRKTQLELGCIPKEKTQDIATIVEDFFKVPCISLKNYLAVTMTPSNPILHTSRLYAMFRDAHELSQFDRNILFYEEWTDASSKVLLTCNEEHQKICNIIPLDLSEVKSLKEYYEVENAEEMTRKIQSIQAFKGLTSPMKQIGGSWYIDWSSRYFVSDFCYGLKILIDFAHLYEVEVPGMEQVWNWYRGLAPLSSVFELGTMTKEEFLEIY